MVMRLTGWRLGEAICLTSLWYHLIYSGGKKRSFGLGWLLHIGGRREHREVWYLASFYFPSDRFQLAEGTIPLLSFPFSLLQFLLLFHPFCYKYNVHTE